MFDALYLQNRESGEGDWYLDLFLLAYSIKINILIKTTALNSEIQCNPQPIPGEYAISQKRYKL